MIGFIFQVCIFAICFLVFSMFIPDFKINDLGTSIKLGAATGIIVLILSSICVSALSVATMVGFPLFLSIVMIRTILNFIALFISQKIISDFQMTITAGITVSILLAVVSSIIPMLFR